MTSASASDERVPVQTLDLLDQDPPIRGQKYVCLSFLSPEKVLQDKHVFMLHRFLEPFAKDLQTAFDNLREKFKESPDTMDLLNNVQERHNHLFRAQDLHRDFEIFQSQNIEQLESEFNEVNKFRTSVRGIKVRGSYESLPEAQKRAELIKQRDPYFDVYVAEVGCWCPWDPSPQELEAQEYAETDLNTMMKRYKENVDLGKVEYEKRKEELKQRAVDQAKRALDENERLMEGGDPWMEKEKASSSKGYLFH